MSVRLASLKRTTVSSRKNIPLFGHEPFMPASALGFREVQTNNVNIGACQAR